MTVLAISLGVLLLVQFFVIVRLWRISVATAELLREKHGALLSAQCANNAHQVTISAQNMEIQDLKSQLASYKPKVS